MRMSGAIALLPPYECMVWTRHLYIYLPKKDVEISRKYLNKQLFCKVVSLQEGDYESSCFIWCDAMQFDK